MGIEVLKEKAQEYLPPEKMAVVEAAYKYADAAHDGQMRKSGEPYIEHPLQTALILALCPFITRILVPSSKSQTYSSVDLEAKIPFLPSGVISKH